MRRRLSSDGFKLLNMAYMPDKTKIQELLSCLFRTDYDDRLESFTENCLFASKQLFAFSGDPIKKDFIKKFIDNSILNVVYAVISKDGKCANAFQMRQNYRYFMDVMDMAYRNGDHNTTMMLWSALDHHALRQMNFKARKKDITLNKRLEEEYGTWRNCYSKHLKDMMNCDDLSIIPSMLVLQMHIERSKCYNNIGPYGTTCTRLAIHGVMGKYAMHHVEEQYTKVLPIYHDPPIKNSTELIILAGQAK